MSEIYQSISNGSENVGTWNDVVRQKNPIGVSRISENREKELLVVYSESSGLTRQIKLNGSWANLSAPQIKTGGIWRQLT